MMGEPLENAKNALMASLSKLNSQDTFNIIAFNGEVQLFSSTMKLATNEAISNATEWIDANLIANGGTNILLPINQVNDQMYSNYYTGSAHFFFNVNFICLSCNIIFI